MIEALLKQQEGSILDALNLSDSFTLYRHPTKAKWYVWDQYGREVAHGVTARDALAQYAAVLDAANKTS